MYKILVVGASIAGLTTAYWLSLYGFQVVVLEQKAELPFGGQVISINKYGYEILSKMNLIEKLLNNFTDIVDASKINHLGEEVERIKYDSLLTETIDNNLMLSRGDLVKTLFANLSCSDVTIHYSTKVKQYTPQDSDVTIHMSSGKEDSFWAVVGADGLHSQTRNFIFPDTAKSFPLQERISFWSSPNFLNLKNSHILYVPEMENKIDIIPTTKNQKLSIVTRFPLPNQKIKNQDDWNSYTRRIISKHSNWISSFLTKSLENCTDFYSITPTQIQIPTWHQDRIALVGDAACCFTPYMGHGASFALLGSYILSSELALAVENKDKKPTEAFLKYEQKLKPFIEMIQQKHDSR